MDQTDYAELALLIRGAEKALIAGHMNEWQHADTTSFHVLASLIRDLNDRVARLEFPSDQSVERSSEIIISD